MCTWVVHFALFNDILILIKKKKIKKIEKETYMLPRTRKGKMRKRKRKNDFPIYPGVKCFSFFNP